MTSAYESRITGIVEAVNERGLKINGAWTNVSKYAVGVVLPERGDAVACTLDKAGFLRSVEVVDAIPAPVSGGSDAPAAPNVRDRTITRLAILKAAAEFGAARPSLKSGDVLAIAATWERWVHREDGVETTYDLTDAF